MKRIPLLTLLLCAACTQQPAPLDYQGNRVYGRDAVYDRSNGTELPKYSADNPGYIPPEQAEKYRAEPQYGVAAEAGTVSASDLPPPVSVGDGITATEPPPGEIGVSGASQPQPQTPFSSGTPAPAPAPATVEIAAEAAPAPPEPPTPAPAITPVTTPTAPVPDYYAQEMAMVGSDETSPSAAAPAPVASQPEFIWPVKGDILSGFGQQLKGKKNDGINIKARKGDPIRAAADGRVAFAGDGVEGLGNMVLIDHGGGWVTNYAHAGEIVVKKNENVVKGQLVGFIGSSGDVDSPQLHFAVLHDKKAADPKALLVED